MKKRVIAKLPIPVPVAAVPVLDASTDRRRMYVPPISDVSANRRRFANLPTPSTDIRHELAGEFFKTNGTGVPVRDFRCDDPACIGVLIEGLVYHCYWCSWWDRAENKTKTPF